MAKNKYETAAFDLVSEALAGQTCDLLDVKWYQEQGEFYLSFIIDKRGGVDINDCEAVSHLIEPLLDEANIIERAYHLEVSSPGIDRPLTTAADFARYQGASVTVSLYQQFLGCKHFVGTLLGYAEGAVTIELDLALQEGELSVKQYNSLLLALAEQAGMQVSKVKDIDFALLPLEITFAKQEWSCVKRYVAL